MPAKAPVTVAVAEPSVTLPVIPGDELGGRLPLGLIVTPVPPLTGTGDGENESEGVESVPFEHATPASARVATTPAIISFLRIVNSPSGT